MKKTLEIQIFEKKCHQPNVLHNSQNIERTQTAEFKIKTKQKKNLSTQTPIKLIFKIILEFKR